MSEKQPLQMNMFDEGMTDTRNRKQRRQAKKTQGYQQEQMFRQRDIAQWGVRLHPMELKIPSGRPLTMQLEIEDPRTAEQKALDRQREAEAQTYSLPAIEPVPVEEGRVLDTRPLEVALPEGR